jgi:hypothetical protein
MNLKSDATDLFYVCDICFALTAAPVSHGEWHAQLTSYLTPTSVVTDAPSTSTERH